MKFNKQKLKNEWERALLMPYALFGIAKYVGQAFIQGYKKDDAPKKNQPRH